MKLNRGLFWAVFSPVFALGAVFCFPLLAQAHLMLVEEESEGLLRVFFDDGTPNRHALVEVYDEDGLLVEEGPVDREGLFYYDTAEAAFIVARDNFGHRAEFTPGQNQQEPLPRVPVTTGVVAGFALIAFHFQRRVNKRAGAGS